MINPTAQSFIDGARYELQCLIQALRDKEADWHQRDSIDQETVGLVEARKIAEARLAQLDAQSAGGSAEPAPALR